MTQADKDTLAKFKKMRDELSHHHPGDDCPYGAPYGGYTVRDTRRGISSITKVIKQNK
jgi:hypothetical protein